MKTWYDDLSQKNEFYGFIVVYKTINVIKCFIGINLFEITIFVVREILKFVIIKICRSFLNVSTYIIGDKINEMHENVSTVNNIQFTVICIFSIF